ncbi:MAG: hypothetical protein GF364_00920, partial [Candidatus Lokiarchaeota archaeon]|nr:hypothetical protein [Candidatus Lokiarchaeota archaeon]
MEGYLLEDFGDLPRYLGIMLQRETKREIKANGVYQEPIKSDARIKSDEAKATVKEEFAEAKEEITDFLAPLKNVVIIEELEPFLEVKISEIAHKHNL